MDNKKISEVMQPYYKLDFDTKANANIKTYPSQEEKNGGEVGTIGKNSIIQVLGYKANAGNKWYLLEGKSGIIGWHNLYRISTEIISENPAWEITQETYSLSFMDKKYGPEG